ncbi:MAG: zinc ribbon domain-containing protein [Acidobacteriota bacterium]|nr:zinc ribbon domain-containing protein [Acidobacteriota bacterium]
METSCQKCGAALAADQAFCSKCGAVVGMGDAGQNPATEWNLAATMVGKKMPPTPPPRPTSSGAAAHQSAAAHTPAGEDSTQPTPARGFSPTLLAVIGFVVVLLIGGLLILLFYMNSHG